MECLEVKCFKLKIKISVDGLNKSIDMAKKKKVMDEMEEKFEETKHKETKIQEIFLMLKCVEDGV